MRLTELIVTRSGALRGCVRDATGVLTFNGILYAAPPVGPLRWRAPQPPGPWTGTRDANRFGPRCPHSGSPGDTDRAPGGAEDCLTLNVWTAAEGADERRPVMGWLHGGGFQFGSGAVAATD